MHIPHNEFEGPESHAELAALGTEMRQILKAEAFQAGVTLTRAQIFTDWCLASSEKELSELKAEQRALERLLQALENIHVNGMIAQDAIRQANAGLDDDIESAGAALV